MQLTKGRSNAERLFGMHALPSDNQLRNLLDPVSPQYLQALYRQVFAALDDAGVLVGYQSFGRQHLVVVDGTTYFKSKKIRNCSRPGG